MRARYLTATVACSALLFAMLASIVTGSDEQQMYARLNPNNGEMEIVEPVLAVASMASPVGRADADAPVKAQWHALLDRSSLAVQPANEAVRFVE